MTTQTTLSFVQGIISDSEIFSVAGELLGQDLPEILENRFSGIVTPEGQHKLKANPHFSSELTSFLVTTIAEEFDRDGRIAKAGHRDFLIEWDIYEVTHLSTSATAWDRAIKSIGNRDLNRKIRAEYSDADVDINFDKVQRCGRFVSVPVSHKSSISQGLQHRMEEGFSAKIKGFANLGTQLAL